MVWKTCRSADAFVKSMLTLSSNATHDLIDGQRRSGTDLSSSLWALPRPERMAPPSLPPPLLLSTYHTSRTHMTSTWMEYMEPCIADVHPAGRLLQPRGASKHLQSQVRRLPIPELEINHGDYMYWPSGCCTVSGPWCTTSNNATTGRDDHLIFGHGRVYPCHLLPSPLPSLPLPTPPQRQRTNPRQEPAAAGCLH